MITFKPQSVNKFYFLDYFYILLKSVENYDEQNKVFNSFKILKQKYQLGESKYKKLTLDAENLSKMQMVRYKYTFEQVVKESMEYGLVRTSDFNYLYITDRGKDLLNNFSEKEPQYFYKSLLPLMESKFNAIHYLLDFCYRVNPKKGGLLIFPIYSPLKLGFERQAIKTTSDIVVYANKLKFQLEKDLSEYLGKTLDLSNYNQQLIDRLISIGLVSSQHSDLFPPNKYNAIINRFRNFWLNIFLKEIYKYNHSFHSFDIWMYRAKQIGIFHVSEFYPNFSGRIVYPTSILTNDKIESNDFEKLYDYQNGNSLYMHKPNWKDEQTLDKFVDALTSSYFDTREKNRNYFVNLADLRERVCYRMKMAGYLFDNFLETAYKLNLSGKLKINISLEADKLPRETNAMYLKREPVVIDGKYRNIIAIDISKGENRYERYRKTS